MRSLLGVGSLVSKDLVNVLCSGIEEVRVGSKLRIVMGLRGTNFDNVVRVAVYEAYATVSEGIKEAQWRLCEDEAWDFN